MGREPRRRHHRRRRRARSRSTIRAAAAALDQAASLGRDDRAARRAELHRGGGARRLPVGQRRLHAQLALCLGAGAVARTARCAGKVGVAALPHGPDGRPPARSAAGTWRSRNTPRHRGLAADLVMFLTSRERAEAPRDRRRLQPDHPGALQGPGGARGRALPGRLYADHRATPSPGRRAVTGESYNRVSAAFWERRARRCWPGKTEADAGARARSPASSRASVGVAGRRGTDSAAARVGGVTGRAALFLAPMLLVLALAAGWPLARTMFFAFTDARRSATSATTHFVGLRQLLEQRLWGGLLADPAWWHAVGTRWSSPAPRSALETVLGVVDRAGAEPASSRGRGAGAGDRC